MSTPPSTATLSSLPGFDPRQVAVLGVDDHLPPVPAQRLQPQALRARMATPPAWQPELRDEALFAPPRWREAAVLIAIVTHERPTVLLTERTPHLPTHAGQIAFPGGKRDASDADARATALREAHEEVGLALQHVEVLGELPVYRTGSAFVITPVLALVPPPLQLHPNVHEVADVFEVPLDFLMNPAHHRHHALPWQGQMRRWFSMPWCEPSALGGRERFIWGASAGLLRNLYRLLIA